MRAGAGEPAHKGTSLGDEFDDLAGLQAGGIQVVQNVEIGHGKRAPDYGLEAGSPLGTDLLRVAGLCRRSAMVAMPV
jgi:hypothetical protein